MYKNIVLNFIYPTAAAASSSCAGERLGNDPKPSDNFASGTVTEVVLPLLPQSTIYSSACGASHENSQDSYVLSKSDVAEKVKILREET
jgi:hypothetical protein